MPTKPQPCSECRSSAAKRRLRNIVEKQLNPAIIAVPQMRQLPGVIGQSSDPLEHEPQASLELRRDRDTHALLHHEECRNICATRTW